MYMYIMKHLLGIVILQHRYFLTKRNVVKIIQCQGHRTVASTCLVLTGCRVSRDVLVFCSLFRVTPSGTYKMIVGYIEDIEPTNFIICVCRECKYGGVMLQNMRVTNRT